ncbi:MAG: tetratricopeptide repeat protein [Alphaproteobacteria bacterium]
MSDIFREVDEDVRKDQLTSLWKKYGVFVIAAAVALVLGTAASVAWREYQASVRTQEAQAYLDAITALQESDTGPALGQLGKLAADGDTGYATLARLQEAAALQRSGDGQAAVASYDTMAEDDDVPEIYRDLARLLAVLILLDDGASEAVSARVNALLAPDNPWRFNAREVDAILALRDGNREAAANKFKSLADDNEAPAGMRSRARQVLAVLGVAAE